MRLAIGAAIFAFIALTAACSDADEAGPLGIVGSEPSPSPAEEREVPETTDSPTQANCSPAYPGVCIPPPPPDLDCGDIAYRRFTVLAPDPHRFDRDGDGIGCEAN